MEIKCDIICIDVTHTLSTIHDKCAVAADEAQCGGLVFQPMIGIPIGTNYAPLLVLFVYLRELYNLPGRVSNK